MKALVFDEISMISGEFFEVLSDVVSEIVDYGKKEKKGEAFGEGIGKEKEWGGPPFGGIQLIVCGDFLQLPPVPPKWEDVREMREAMETWKEEKRKRLALLLLLLLLMSLLLLLFHFHLLFLFQRTTLFLNRGYAFQSRAWADANFGITRLTEVFRQKKREFSRGL